jgi:hypothetical protein
MQRVKTFHCTTSFSFMLAGRLFSATVIRSPKGHFSLPFMPPSQIKLADGRHGRVCVAMAVFLGKHAHGGRGHGTQYTGAKLGSILCHVVFRNMAAQPQCGIRIRRLTSAAQRSIPCRIFSTAPKSITNSQLCPGKPC